LTVRTLVTVRTLMTVRILMTVGTVRTVRLEIRARRVRRSCTTGRYGVCRHDMS